ncbi:MAG: NUDIX hydrolase [Candidatus Woesearchaeota archaeon]
MKRTTQLECIVYRRNNNKIEYLILKRTPEKGGFWQPVCGGLEKDDSSLLDGAFRELKEEANISKDDVMNIIKNVHYFEMTKHYLTGEPIPKVKEYVFGFEIYHEFEVSIDNNIYVEHTEFRWVDLNEALSLLKWENNKNAFKKLENKLKKI